MAITKVSFNPLTWVNQVTKRSAPNYNRQEKGIDDCAKAVNAVIDELEKVNNNLVAINYTQTPNNITGTQNFTYLITPGRYTGAVYPSNTVGLPDEFSGSSQVHLIEAIVKAIDSTTRFLELTAYNSSTGALYKYIRAVNTTNLTWSTWAKVSN